jgi:hypothetical protein
MEEGLLSSPIAAVSISSAHTDGRTSISPSAPTLSSQSRPSSEPAPLPRHQYFVFVAMHPRMIANLAGAAPWHVLPWSPDQTRGDTDPEGLSYATEKGQPYVIQMGLRGVQNHIYEVKKVLGHAQSPWRQIWRITSYIGLKTHNQVYELSLHKGKPKVKIKEVFGKIQDHWALIVYFISPFVCLKLYNQIYLVFLV